MIHLARRVVVSDRDPFLNGVIAHCVGVGLEVAMSESPGPLSVAVLGATNLSDPRMARFQTQRFAARHINHLESVVGVVQIVTLTGCGTAPVEVDFLQRCGGCVLSLARFDLDGSWEHATMHVEDAHGAFQAHPDGSAIAADDVRLGGLCRDVAVAIAESLGGR